MAHLSGTQKEVIELCYVEGLSQQAVAERLGLPLGTVKTHARRGLLMLRQQLNSEAEGN